ncbi:polysaccharide deacetylase family protein [Paenibacillus sp.]|jgi:peptidoglycan/xylan/chitin deacetylase (PgdA/CDA1 family)|uniref:polysaccharide deacetylase family protein n=1 Tax=Paenibacillus sp. TaxID=58172 RepID=UPI0028314FBD|nr:polysaccharide deacetylase family protein [Paenibacillus sp.]MDR0269092.1 polysaccharide deacetylase family protein [Paenibacillus sp.]
MGKKTAALLLITALLLSGCGGKSETAVKNIQTSGQESGETANNATGTTDDAGQDNAKRAEKEKMVKMLQTKDESAVKNNNDQDSAGGQNDPADVPLKYHMNKAYNIVPNEETGEKKVVLLTFDDGPKKAEWINSLIDTLDKHHAKAVFFVNGYRVKENPDLLKVIHDRGQIIGNHSWDHISLRKEPEAKVKQQIEDVQKIVKDTVGETPVFFRPPFGEGGDIDKKIAKENGLLYMTWSNGSLDWTMKSKGTDNPQKVIKNVMDQLHAGSNILMHELPWTAEALDQLLTKLENEGYTFVDPRSIELEMR